jgi:hypothetical protein
VRPPIAPGALAASLITLAPSVLRAQAMPPLFPSEEQRSLSIVARAGGGADSNVNRDPDATTNGGLFRGDLRAEAEPLTDLRLVLDGVFEGDIASTASFIYDAEAGLVAGYRRAIAGGLSFAAGSFSELTHEPSVFLEGGVITNGALFRTQLGERLAGYLEYALGPIEIEAGGRGEVAHVVSTHVGSPTDLEDYTELGGEASAGLRAFIIPDRLTLRARYTYDAQSYSGLPARDSMGTPIAPPRDVFLRTHGLRMTARVRPHEAVTAALHFDQEWIEDTALAFLSGNRQRFRAELYFELGPIASELAGEVVLRHYSTRTVTVDDPSDETMLIGWLDTDVWINRWLGVYLRYQIEDASANPTGQIYLRHAITLGPSLRFEAGT